MNFCDEGNKDTIFILLCNFIFNSPIIWSRIFFTRILYRHGLYLVGLVWYACPTKISNYLVLTLCLKIPNIDLLFQIVYQLNRKQKWKPCSSFWYVSNKNVLWSFFIVNIFFLIKHFVSAWNQISQQVSAFRTLKAFYEAGAEKYSTWQRRD